MAGATGGAPAELGMLVGGDFLRAASRGFGRRRSPTIPHKIGYGPRFIELCLRTTVHVFRAYRPQLRGINVLLLRASRVVVVSSTAVYAFVRLFPAHAIPTFKGSLMLSLLAVSSFPVSQLVVLAEMDGAPNGSIRGTVIGGIVGGLFGAVASRGKKKPK